MITAMLAVVPALTSVLFLGEVSKKPAYDFVDDHFVINADMGGDIDSYAKFYGLIEKTNSPVWVTNLCMSACTMVLRNPHACATPKAWFGFHSARVYDKRTLEELGDSDNGNRLLWLHYPEKVRAKLGGRLGTDMVYIKGTELLPKCVTNEDWMGGKPGYRIFP
jgi:hypothetical protein